MVKRRRDWVSIVLAAACFLVPVITETMSYLKQRSHHPGMVVVLFSAGVLLILMETERIKVWHFGATIGALLFGLLIESGLGLHYAFIAGVLLGLGAHFSSIWMTDIIVSRTVRRIETKYSRTSEGESP